MRGTVHGNCNMTLGKDRRTHDLSLVILHEAWFQELVEERLSERFGRDDLKKTHLLKKFDIMNEGWDHKIAIYEHLDLLLSHSLEQQQQLKRSNTTLFHSC